MLINSITGKQSQHKQQLTIAKPTTARLSISYGEYGVYGVCLAALKPNKSDLCKAKSADYIVSELSPLSMGQPQHVFAAASPTLI